MSLQNTRVATIVALVPSAFHKRFNAEPGTCVKKETFFRRLSEGRSNSFMYSNEHVEGLVSVWVHGGQIILTWEECPPGGQYEEHAHTKDIRRTFSNESELQEFLSENSLRVEMFTP